MDGFISRKRRYVSPQINDPGVRDKATNISNIEEESTDLKLAVLISLFPHLDQNDLLDVLIASEGSVEAACLVLAPKESPDLPLRKRQASGTGIQSSLLAFQPTPNLTSPIVAIKPLTRKGKTLHLYVPGDIAKHTPCSIIHNFLPPDEAIALLKELLQEAPTFERQSFKIFDNIVQSPHSACFYVEDMAERKRQQTEYLYNGSYLSDVRELTPEMRNVKGKVQEAVNKEIDKRIRDFYPEGKKLKYQSPKVWVPNAAFVNQYDGGAESVGYHSDQLTYLGPRAVIGSLSLGVAREFRVRKVVARKDQDGVKDSSPKKATPKDTARADEEGQISIHLPHNSLLVMHAEMQEEWKHSIAPAQSISPHPVAGNKRINVTYRWYRDSFHPKYTPKCRCGVATVLKCVQKKQTNRGRYMWMCHVGNTPGKEGCSFFQWADFDEDGEPPWTVKSAEENGQLSTGAVLDSLMEG